MASETEVNFEEAESNRRFNFRKLFLGRKIGFRKNEVIGSYDRSRALKLNIFQDNRELAGDKPRLLYFCRK